MPELNRPHAVVRAAAVPATPTSALRAVAVLLVVVLLVAAAVMVINVVARAPLTDCRPPCEPSPEPQRERCDGPR